MKKIMQLKRLLKFYVYLTFYKTKCLNNRIKYSFLEFRFNILNIQYYSILVEIQNFCKVYDIPSVISTL